MKCVMQSAITIIQRFVLVLCITSFAPLVLAEQVSGAVANTKFWQALQEGGKVVLVRHAAIDKEFASPFTLDETCFSERNLNELGQAQAQEINKAFKANHVKIEKVLSSPYCRTKETAELAFGSFQVKPELHLTKAITADKAADYIQKTRDLIGNYELKSAKSNLILVTHRPNILELSNVNTEPADMVLLQPLGDGLYEVIAHFKNTHK